MILQSLAGLPAFLVYFCTALVSVAAYLFIYTRVTPHDEFLLIRDNNPAAAIALKGQSTQLTLADAGIYDYICGLHPAMKGKIEVKE